MQREEIAGLFGPGVWLGLLMCSSCRQSELQHFKVHLFGKSAAYNLSRQSSQA